jgi:hypothetical protein
MPREGVDVQIELRRSSGEVTRCATLFGELIAD